MPARKARGAIVEKGEKRRKVIGDYLNNHHPLRRSRDAERHKRHSHAERGNDQHKTNVGAGLPAMTMAQATSLLTDTPPSRASPAPTGSCVTLKPYFLALALSRSANANVPTASIHTANLLRSASIKGKEE